MTTALSVRLAARFLEAEWDRIAKPKYGMAPRPRPRPKYGMPRPRTKYGKPPSGDPF